MTQFHFTPERYLELMRGAIPVFDEFEQAVAAATLGVQAKRILDLGTGTGETARRALDLHPSAKLTGVDASAEMLALARAALPADRVDGLLVQGFEQPLPAGGFDLVVSALAVHHLDPLGKADLFRRIATSLTPGGRFVIGDVIIPTDAAEAVTPISPEHDDPDSVDHLFGWLRAAGLQPSVVWGWKDLVVIVASIGK